MKDPETLSPSKHSKGQNGKLKKKTNQPHIPAQAWEWEQRLLSLSKH